MKKDSSPPEPQRILFFDFAVAMGGSIMVLLHTLRALDRSKYTPAVVTGLPPDVAREVFGSLATPVVAHRHFASYVARYNFLSRPIFASPWRKRLGSYVFTVYSRIANLLPSVRLLFQVMRLKPSLIHSHNAVDSVMIARVLGIPAVLHLHGPYGEQSSLEVKMAKAVRKCICVSQGIATILADRGVQADKLVVLHNPAPPPDCDEAAKQAYRTRFAGNADNRILVAHIGRLVPWKGQMEFLRAFATIARDVPNVTVLVIGDDVEGLNQAYVERLHAFAREQGFEDRVIFTGHINDIHNLMAVVDVVVHSSTKPEPFGLVVTEAMMLSKPVVGANLGAIVDIVDDGVTGYVVDPNDADALGAAIRKVATDEALRSRLGAAARERAQQEYSIEHYKYQIEQIYDEALRAS